MASLVGEFRVTIVGIVMKQHVNDFLQFKLISI